jgi:hypothetical protein
MQYCGIQNWPPVWTRTRGEDAPRTLRGEVGVLTFVLAMPRISQRCYLVIDQDDKSYVGTLLFDDRAFCKQITDLLRLNVNRPIKDIGDLEVGHTL